MVTQVLVSYGIADAVEANLEIGDVVATKSTCLDQGVPGPLLPLAVSLALCYIFARRPADDRCRQQEDTLGNGLTYPSPG